MTADPRCDVLESQLFTLQADFDKLRAIVQQVEEKRRAGQPDWLTVQDPAKAEAMLIETVLWMERYGTHLLLPTPLPCWPWHPRAVDALTKARVFHKAAHRGSEAAVIDLYLRVFKAKSGIAIEVEATMRDCNTQVHHATDDDDGYEVRLDELPALAHWWVGARDRLAPGLYDINTIRRAA